MQQGAESIRSAGRALVLAGMLRACLAAGDHRCAYLEHELAPGWLGRELVERAWGRWNEQRRLVGFRGSAGRGTIGISRQEGLVRDRLRAAPVLVGRDG